MQSAVNDLERKKISWSKKENALRCGLNKNIDFLNVFRILGVKTGLSQLWYIEPSFRFTTPGLGSL